MVFLIVAAALFVVAATRLLLDESPEEAVLEALEGHARLQAQAIADARPSERRETAERLSKRVGYPLRLEPREGGSEAEGDGAAPRAEWRRGLLYVIAPVPQSYGQIALGPVPYQRRAAAPWVLALSIVISLLAALLALRPLSRSIRSLEGVATRMRAGDFSVRSNQQPGEALAEIGESLDQLADRIGQLLSDERELLRSVAHEVRAPIARMHFRVEKIHRKAEADVRKDTGGLVRDLEQVDRLFEELLTYVAFDEFDYERPPLQTKHVAVVAAVRRVADEVTATDETVHVKVSGDEAISVVANPKLFDRAVTNLLLNAMVYGPPDIQVEVREFDEECVVDVQDSGPGIAELDRPRVIKPFVRLASNKTRGTGLGLAIVSRIMRLHEGRLHIVDAPSGGASMQLVWKNASPKPKRRWRFPLGAPRTKQLAQATAPPSNEP